MTGLGAAEAKTNPFICKEHQQSSLKKAHDPSDEEVKDVHRGRQVLLSVGAKWDLPNGVCACENRHLEWPPCFQDECKSGCSDRPDYMSLLLQFTERHSKLLLPLQPSSSSRQLSFLYHHFQ